MSPMISFRFEISAFKPSRSSSAAPSSSFSWIPIFSFVLSMAACSSLHASSLCSWSTTDSPLTPAAPASSSVVVMEAYSRARESLKWASARTSDSGGWSASL